VTIDERNAGRGSNRVLSDDDRNAAVSLLRRGVPVAHIAARLDRPVSTIRSFLLRERHHLPDNNMTPWTSAEEEIVRHEYRKTKVRILAQRLGRTRNEVIGKAHRLLASEARAS
jgi:IS30 family transposase